ncbi:hypothetical protein SDC9_172663 [bioreactor metagenome]|uniref:Uncharacterized protein n=1 Tax=bioreactor metagenome TaxID=1076179 RepID=A0A645GGF4_9ZZZZ
MNVHRVTAGFEQNFFILQQADQTDQNIVLTPTVWRFSEHLDDFEQGRDHLAVRMLLDV